MNEKINVLGVRIHHHTAKEAMKLAVYYMQTDGISMVEVVSVHTLVKAGEMPELKTAIEGLDLIVAGDKAILEAAGITDRKTIQETEQQVFFRMLMRYMHKNHKRIFILAESEELSAMFQAYVEGNYKGIEVLGALVEFCVPEHDDMITNSINGIEVDCVVSLVDSPAQEVFMMRNRALLNANMWLGLGKVVRLNNQTVGKTGWLKEFVAKKMFKHQIEKHKKEQ